MVGFTRRKVKNVHGSLHLEKQIGGCVCWLRPHGYCLRPFDSGLIPKKILGNDDLPTLLLAPSYSSDNRLIAGFPSYQHPFLDTARRVNPSKNILLRVIPTMEFCLTYILAFNLAYFLTFYLSFYLPFYLTFYLAFNLVYIPTFYLKYILTYYLTVFLAFYLRYILTFYVAFNLTCILTFYLAYILAFYVT